MAADEQDQPSADVSLKVAGQEVNIRNVKSVNTILTTVAAVAALFVVYLILFPVSQAITDHRTEAKEVGKAFVDAIREQTTALREQTSAAKEQTCLLRFDQKDRQPNAEFCRQVSR